MTRTLLAAALALLLVLTTGACADASSRPAETPSVLPTATPEVRASVSPQSTASPKAIPPGAVTPASPTQPPTPTPTPLPRTRPPTGNATADAAIAAIEARDVAALLALMHYELRQCVETRELGDPVECPPAVARGTPLDVFAWSQCEGRSRPREDASDVLRSWLGAVQSVYGAYRVTPRGSDGRLGEVVFVVVRAKWPGGSEHAQHLFFDDDPRRSTWVAMGCVDPVEPYTADLARRGDVELLGVPAAP